MKIKVNNPNKLTCVIASLGTKKLFNALESLMNSSLCPEQILICLPKNSTINLPEYSNSKIIILNSDKGQVNQRIHAIKNVKTNLILQIDDDIKLDKDCIDILYKNLIKMGPGNIVGANLINSQILKERTLNKKHLCGKITSYGEAHTVKKCCFHREKVYTEWLPGGCTMYFLQDSITENYYPFEGKAFNEDIICSFYQKKSGAKHFLIPSARCYLVEHDDTLNFFDLKKYFISKKYYLKLIGNIEFLFYLNFIKIVLGVLLKKTLKLIKVI